MASVQWTKHIKDQKDKDNFLLILNNSTTVLSRLAEILIEKSTEISNSECSVSDFADPAWSHKQAFRNGQRAVLKELTQLITIKKEK